MATLEIRTGAPAPNVVEVFCSYSHKDLALREELDTHLQPLQAHGLINCWHDHAIPAGEDWESQIAERLNSAQIILLLVSADFMASRHCQIEMRRALERRSLGKAKVIPIMLRHVDLSGSPLDKLQTLPKDRRPVITFSDRDQAFKDITIGIRKVAEKLIRQQIRTVRPVTEHKTAGQKQELRPRGREAVAKKYAVIAVTAVLVLGGLVYLAREGRQFELQLELKFEMKRLQDKQWKHAAYDDPDFSNCMGVPKCVEWKNYADRLQKTDWNSVNFDFPLLGDCMDLPACVERAKQAALLKAKDWTNAGPGDPLRKDCMGYGPCRVQSHYRADPDGEAPNSNSSIMYQNQR